MELASFLLQEIQETIDEGNLPEFKQLLKENPDYLRDENGLDLWLRTAARRGLLPFVKFLVLEKGLSVNESGEYAELPEGPIKDASAKGRLDVVRWLLEQGALINFEVNGVLRCSPLTSAVIHSQLEVVKTLVEHGAAINATWKGDNALSYAQMYGEVEIAEYLISKGAKLPEELVERDIPAGHSAILEHVARHKGELHAVKPLTLPDAMPGEPAIAVYATQPSDDSPMQTVFTLGMSDRDIPLGDDGQLRGELAIFLPPDWPLTPEALVEDQHNWPINWLLRIARDSQDSQSWPAPIDPLIMNGDPPQPLTPGTDQCGFLCRLEQTPFAELVLPDNRLVRIITLFPIDAEEAALVREEGADALAERFLERDVPLYVDPRRKSAMK